MNVWKEIFSALKELDKRWTNFNIPAIRMTYAPFGS